MALPKGIMVSLGKLSDMDIFITSLVFFVVFFIAFCLIVRNLFSKLGIDRIYGLPIPLFLATIFAVLVIFSSLSSHQLVCQTCHQMRPSAKELRQSEHSGIGCAACHKKSNIMSLPVQKLEQARMVFNYLKRDYSLPILTTVSNDICLSCHRDIENGVKTRSKIMVSHSEIIEEGISCTECHVAVAHKKKAGVRQNAFMMERCSSCHNDEEASARCETCHLDNVWLGMKPSKSWGINHDDNWPKLHGSRSLYVCKSCHSEKDCNRCHSSVPHPEGWPYIHGEEGKSDSSDCRVCHKEESICRECHSVDMPHPKGWLAAHKSQDKAIGRDTCLSCHLVKDCQQCHERHKNRCGNAKKG